MESVLLTLANLDLSRISDFVIQYGDGFLGGLAVGLALFTKFALKVVSHDLSRKLYIALSVLLYSIYVLLIALGFIYQDLLVSVSMMAVERVAYFSVFLLVIILYCSFVVFVLCLLTRQNKELWE